MSNQLKLEHICNEDEPLKYSMWFPGSCTMFCIYKRTGQENDYYLEEKACYDDYCCGKVYWMCWDDNLGQWNITEYQMGNDEGNCDEPTGNPPDWRCSAAKEGYSWIGASHCHNSCEYSTE